MATKKMTMGMIVGNRGFFPDHLAKTGREEMLRVLSAAGMDVVALTPEESKYGAVETREESRRCADLFKRNRDRIDKAEQVASVVERPGQVGRGNLVRPGAVGVDDGHESDARQR